ncbi:flippase [bacterium]|nr:flippase [bacterium]
MKGIKRVFSNALFIFAARNVGTVLSFLLVVLIARLLGPEVSGNFETAFRWIVFTAAFAGFGMDFWSVRKVAREPQKSGLVFSNVLGAKMLLSLVAFAGVLLLSIGVDDPQLSLLLIIGGVSIPFTSAFDAAQAILQAFEKMKVLALCLSSLSVVITGINILALCLGASVTTVMLIYVIGMVLRAIVLCILARRFGASFRLNLLKRGRMVRLVVESAPFAALGILSILFYNVDIYLLNWLKGPKSVGLYAPGLRAIEALLIIPNAFAIAAFPFFVKILGDSKDSLRQANYFCAKAMLLLGIPLCLLLFLWSRTAVDLALGPKFAATPNAIMLLSFMLPFAFANTVFGRALIALGKERIAIYYVAGATLLNASLNLMVIPSFGFMGAAAVTVFSDIVSFSIGLYFLSRFLGKPDFGSLILKPVATLLLCGITAIICLRLGLGPFVGTMLCLVVYLLLLRVLGQASPSEIALLASSFRRGDSKPSPSNTT